MSQGNEVDLIVELPGAPRLAIEVKYGERLRADAFQGLRTYLGRDPKARALLLVPATVALTAPIAPEGIEVRSLELFAAGLGRQLEQIIGQ